VIYCVSPSFSVHFLLSNVIKVTIIAYLIAKTIQVTSGTASLLLLMVVITVTIASARVALVVLQVVPQKDVFVARFSDKLDIPSTLLSDFEIFFGAIVSCFPGLRAWRRYRTDARGSNTSNEGEQKEGSMMDDSFIGNKG
jgi:hypothetical protein